MTGQIRALLLATCISAAMAASAVQAQNSKDTWNMYEPYKVSTFLPFATPISIANAPTLDVQVGSMTVSRQAIVDTGSIGLQISRDLWNPIGQTPIGAGSIFLSSSNVTNSGNFYNTTVQFTDSNGKPVTSTVPVLVVTQSCKGDDCKEPTQLVYMGVGLNRSSAESLVSPNNQLVNGTTLNPFLNVTRIDSQTVAPEKMRQGYIIDSTTSGVTVGLTQQNSHGFSFVKLTSNGNTPLDPWNAAPVTVTVTNTSAQSETFSSGPAPPLKGGVLPDSGINYMFLQATSNVTTTVSCTLSGEAKQCLPTNTQIAVVLPGNGAASPLAEYSFTVGAAPPTVIQPTDASPVSGGGPFLNTGRQFFLGFTYLYDAQGGYVGYAATPGLSGSGTVNAGLALVGPVALVNNFTETLPVYLIGDTTLQQSGSGTIGGSVAGSGFNLAVATGTVNFGAAIDMGGGSFVVQNAGSASLASTLLADSVQVVRGGSLTNNGQITATSVFNGGTLTNNAQITATTLTNTGTLINNGTINAALVNTGTLNGNGSYGGDFVNNAVLAGNPTIGGDLVNSGILAPGNSIGTVTVVGNATFAAGTTYNVEVSAQGQSDKVVVGGTTTIQGGTVAAQPQSGVYAPRTTYTILTSAGGVAGTFASASSSNPFLLPSLSYGANAVELTLTIGGFLAAAQNPVQAAVGATLDRSVLLASGDYAQVLGILANTSPSQVPAILTSLSGMNYSGFSNSMVQTAQLFMSNFSDMAGGAARGRNRVALAEACEVACDASDPAPATWGAWGGALGGLGTVGAGANLGGVTYNLGGFAGGLDRAVSDTVRAGVAVGYTTGSQWVSGFSGQGFSNSVQAGLYGSWLQGPAYFDGIAGYAYTGNQLNRPINIPGLPARTAMGSAGANQAYGQLEGGWRFDLGTAAAAWLSPFARLQGYTGTQGAFTESGAQSLSLAVAAQTTTSLRSVLGAQIGGAADLGWKDKLTAQLRLGWSHEYSNTARPVTASFVGAPGLPFTTYGVSPTRDGAVVGFTAGTAIADNASFYTRYEGMIAGQDSTHALTAGVRVTW
ncbi:MAG: autotransporter domain-containing protein [Reyranellaceae bacterium]